jgi:hypothetical protein
VTYIEVLALFTQIDRAQPHGKQCTTQGLENVAHGFAGRQFPTAHFPTDSPVTGTPVIPRSAQLTDDPVQLPVAGQAFGASL